MNPLRFHLKGEYPPEPPGPGRVWLNGKEITPAQSLKVRTHSPTGFAWGYNGSGPAQLSLAILLKLMPQEEAALHYQQLKFDVIGRLPQSDFEKEIEWTPPFAGTE